MLARGFVEDINAALELYQKPVRPPALYRFHDVELTHVGPFLLLSGNTAA